MAKQHLTKPELLTLWRCPAYRALMMAKRKETADATRAARAVRVERYRAECRYRPAPSLVQAP